MKRKAVEILDTLLGEWGASPAFEKEQLDKAQKALLDDLLAMVPKGTRHCPGIATAWCDDCLLEFVSKVGQMEQAIRSYFGEEE